MRKLGGTPNKSWTEDEVNYLRRHALEMSCGEMARELGRSPNSVSSYLNYHHIPRRGNRGPRARTHPPSTSYEQKPKREFTPPPLPLIPKKEIVWDPTPCSERDLDWTPRRVG